MARKLGLDINAVINKEGKVDKSKCTIEKHEAMLAFGKEGKLAANAVKGPKAIKKALTALQ